jgi:NAD(P)-dependent dehydrogenase (short-subunit alcohol dehydrogenase family)
MVFFITGGSRGIGASIVLQALREGHNVVFTFFQDQDHAAEVLAQARTIAPERQCRAYPLDVRDSSALETLADTVLEEFKTVHVVVSNAGITLNCLAVSTTDEDWRNVIDTNLTGAFYVCRQFLPEMLAQRFGRILLVSSVSHRGISGQAAYAASKAGLLGLSATLAKEYGRRGITCNAVVPGLFETDMARESVPEKNRSWWTEYCPLGRLGEVSEIARVVTFLASDAAAFINGQAIEINGGLDWAP